MPDDISDEFGPIPEPEPTPQELDEAAMAAEDRYLQWLWGRDSPDP